jgi:hypothetical protein
MRLKLGIDSIRIHYSTTLFVFANKSQTHQVQKAEPLGTNSPWQLQQISGKP